MNYVETVFDFMFDVFLKALLSIWTCKQLLETDWDVGGSKFGFWGEKLCRTDDCLFKRSVSEHLLEVIHLSEKSFAQAKCSLTTFPVSRSYVFFTCFYFELAFGVNMKVLDNFVRFPMDLMSLENVFWILCYDENTPSGS